MYLGSVCYCNSVSVLNEINKVQHLLCCCWLWVIWSTLLKLNFPFLPIYQKVITYITYITYISRFTPNHTRTFSQRSLSPHCRLLGPHRLLRLIERRPELWRLHPQTAESAAADGNNCASPHPLISSEQSAFISYQERQTREAERERERKPAECKAEQAQWCRKRFAGCLCLFSCFISAVTQRSPRDSWEWKQSGPSWSHQRHIIAWDVVELAHTHQRAAARGVSRQGSPAVWRS